MATQPKPGRSGMHTARADHDNATDIAYDSGREGAGQWRCGIRIDDNEPPERIAKKLRCLAKMIEDGAVNAVTR